MKKLLFESMFNTRDFSGVISCGKKIKSNLLLRSDNTAFATEHDINTLIEYGIKTIIDIRSEKERMEEPDILASIPMFNYYFIPFDVDDFAYYLSRNPLKMGVSLKQGYINLLEQKTTVATIVTKISNALSDGGVLFHCSGGKDRTGLISMLILSLLDATYEEILNDYHQTYFNLMDSPKIQDWVMKFSEEYVFCDQDLMKATIQHIERKYNSVEEYLLCCGVKKQSIESIRLKMIGDGR